MKKWWLILLVGLLWLIRSSQVLANNDQIYFFYGQGCGYCATVDEYFRDNDIYKRYPVVRKEIYFDRDNAVLYNQVLSELGVPESGRVVPTLVMGDKLLVGGRMILDNFESEVEIFLSQNDPVESAGKEKQANEGLTILMVLGASLVDAINPCAFAVLIILMSTVLASGQSKRALKAGLAFALSIFISYFLMGLGLYKALAVSGLSGIFMKVIGWLAIVLGLLNLKDWLWYGKGFLMEVPMSWRPKMKSLIKSVTSPTGAFLIGFLVSLFLLPCTSGPYIVILGMLAEKATYVKALGYLVLYNLVFVFPMVLITWLVYKGLEPERVEKLRQKHLKTLHLIAGVLLLAIGIFLLN